ncbi:MAG: NAD(P)H-dependent oxidoreductase subunit E [Bacillota bacterium]
MADGGKFSPSELRYRSLDKIIEKYRDKPGGLIRVLQKAQDLFGYLSRDVQIYVADRMCLPIGHVHGVATFYSGFVTAPRGKYTCSVCLGTACYVKGAQDVLNRFKEVLGINEDEATEDKLFTLRATRCIGACSLAPVLTVNEDVHGYMTVEEVAPLIESYRAEETREDGDEVAVQPERPRADQGAVPPSS